MSLQGINSNEQLPAPLQVPASLRRSPTDQQLVLGIKDKVSTLNISPDKKASINGTVDKVADGNPETTLNPTDKSNISGLVDTYDQIPNLDHSSEDNNTMSGLRDKLAEPGDSKVDKKEKSFIMRILSAIVAFFAKIFEFLAHIFSGGGSKDKENRDTYSTNQMRAGNSAPSIPIPTDEPKDDDQLKELPPDAANTELPKGPIDNYSFDNYLDLARSKGAKIDLSPNKRNIVTLRVPTNPDANGGKGLYDDKTAVLWVDDKGEKHLKTFVSNADPSAQYAGHGYSANSGRIKEGSYTYRPDDKGRLAPVGNVAVERFMDGKFVDTDERKNDFLIHSGASNNNTGSAGCQTMPPEEYQQFMESLKNDGQIGDVSYTIINMPESK